MFAPCFQLFCRIWKYWRISLFWGSILYYQMQELLPTAGGYLRISVTEYVSRWSLLGIICLWNHCFKYFQQEKGNLFPLFLHESVLLALDLATVGLLLNSRQKWRNKQELCIFSSSQLIHRKFNRYLSLWIGSKVLSHHVIIILLNFVIKQKQPRQLYMMKLLSHQYWRRQLSFDSLKITSGYTGMNYTMQNSQIGFSIY